MTQIKVAASMKEILLIALQKLRKTIIHQRMIAFRLSRIQFMMIIKEKTRSL